MPYMNALRCPLLTLPTLAYQLRVTSNAKTFDTISPPIIASPAKAASRPALPKAAPWPPSAPDVGAPAVPPATAALVPPASAFS